MPKDRPPASCFECAGMLYCYRTAQPALTREEARTTAAACAKLNKGRVIEVVQVEARDRGMSRKNAEELVLKGEAEWVAPRLVRVLESGQNRKAAGKP